MPVVLPSLAQARRFFPFYLRANTLYDVHSPLVVSFIREVLEDDRQYYAFPTIEAYRKSLRENRNVLSIRDYGAGSQTNRSRQRPISELAQAISVSPRLGRLLFRLVRWHQPNQMLELGSALGISGMYQAAAAPSASFTTIEGNPETAQFTARQFPQIGLPQVEVLSGTFEQVLPQYLADRPPLDYLFIDGDHRLSPTISYVRQCRPHMPANALIAIADIYWSPEMQQAWRYLQKLPGVTLSIDLFEIGLLWFRLDIRQPLHLRLVPRWWKPWRLGLGRPAY